MTLRADIQSLAPGGVIELFILDATKLGAGAVLPFCAIVSQNAQSIVWQGVSYTPLPITATGFQWSGQGTLPRPVFEISNFDGTFGALAAQYGGLIGATVTRKKTLTQYLDAANFVGGVNPTADPTQFFDDEIWIVDRKASESNLSLQFELASTFDLPGVLLPGRQFIQNVCAGSGWQYRIWNPATASFNYANSANCGYTGSAYFTASGAQTGDPTQDDCSRTLAGCKLRFGMAATVPYGGFPGVGRV